MALHKLHVLWGLHKHIAPLMTWMTQGGSLRRGNEVGSWDGRLPGARRGFADAWWHNHWLLSASDIKSPTSPSRPPLCTGSATLSKYPWVKMDGSSQQHAAPPHLKRPALRFHLQDNTSFSWINCFHIFSFQEGDLHQVAIECRFALAIIERELARRRDGHPTKANFRYLHRLFRKMSLPLEPATNEFCPMTEQPEWLVAHITGRQFAGSPLADLRQLTKAAHAAIVGLALNKLTFNTESKKSSPTSQEALPINKEPPPKRSRLAPNAGTVLSHISACGGKVPDWLFTLNSTSWSIHGEAVTIETADAGLDQGSFFLQQNGLVSRIQEAPDNAYISLTHEGTMVESCLRTGQPEKYIGALKLLCRVFPKDGQLDPLLFVTHTPVVRRPLTEMIGTQ